MPKNGVAVRLAPEPAPANPSANDQEGIEAAIGAAVAAAACAICQGVAEKYQGAGLTPLTRAAGGERIAKMFELQEAHAGEIDFAIVAREQGKVVLRRYLGDGFYRQYSQEQGDAAIDMFIDETLAVLARVTATMRAWAN